MESVGTFAADPRGGTQDREDTSVAGKVLFAAIAGLVFFATLSGIRPTDRTTVGDIAIVFALACIVARLAVEPRSRWRLIAPAWLLVAGAGLLAAGLLVELFPPSSIASIRALGAPTDTGTRISSGIDGAVRLTAAMVLVPMLIATTADSPRRINLLADVWIAAALVSSAVGVLDSLGGVSLAELITGDNYSFAPRAAGLTSHPNALGLSAMMVLPLVLVRLGRSQGLRRLGYLGALALLVGGVAVTGSRSALAGGIVGVAIVAMLDTRSRRACIGVGVLAVAAAGVALAVGSSALPTLDRLLERTPGAQSSTETHMETFREVVPRIGARPVVGHGFELIRGAHNLYLQLLYAGGAVALLSFLTFVAGSLRAGLTAARASPPTNPDILSAALVASMAVWLSSAMLTNLILDRFLYIPAGLMLAVWALGTRAQPEPRAAGS